MVTAAQGELDAAAYSEEGPAHGATKEAVLLHKLEHQKQVEEKAQALDLCLAALAEQVKLVSPKRLLSRGV